jgi:hypothetical protein
MRVRDVTERLALSLSRVKALIGEGRLRCARRHNSVKGGPQR